MKYLILTMLLSVVQAAPPVPQKAADSPTSASQKIQKKTIDSQTPATPLQPPVNASAAPNHDAARNEQGTENAQNSVSVSKLPPVTMTAPKRDWVDWGFWVFNLLLVVVGGLQVWVLIRQAKLMKTHAGHFERLATETKNNAEAAREAAAATQASTEVIKTQVGIMERQTKATETAAESARQNIDILIGKERARIRVEPDKLKLAAPIISVSRTIYPIDFSISIYGQTPAYIVSSGCSAYIRTEAAIGSSEEHFLLSIARFPAVINPSATPTQYQTYILEDDDIISDVKADKLFIELKGFINYKDTFDGDRYTKFRFVWKFSNLPAFLGSTERYGDWYPCGTPEDNQGT